MLIDLFQASDCPYCFKPLNYLCDEGGDKYYCHFCNKCSIQVYNSHLEITLTQHIPQVCNAYYYPDIKFLHISDGDKYGKTQCLSNIYYSIKDIKKIFAKILLEDLLEPQLSKSLEDNKFESFYLQMKEIYQDAKEIK